MMMKVSADHYDVAAECRVTSQQKGETKLIKREAFEELDDSRAAPACFALNRWQENGVRKRIRH
jgi:hypothetical protein